MTKHELLEHLDRVIEATAAEVATAFGEEDAAAGMALLRLVRQGLASREFDEPAGAYVYALTDKGPGPPRLLRWRGGVISSLSASQVRRPPP